LDFFFPMICPQGRAALFVRVCVALCESGEMQAVARTVLAAYRQAGGAGRQLVPPEVP
jgi:hypothetical protein